MTKKTIYQAVTSLEPFLISEYLDFGKAAKNPCLFFIEKKFSRTHTTSYSGNKYDIFDYRFLNKEGDEYILKNNDWTVEEIGKGFFDGQGENMFGISTWSDWNKYLISDPNGELRNVGFSLPKLAFKHFNKFSEFGSWQEYDIHNQIDNILDK
ncbi:hypothetical protein DC20_19035 [Rufibacter tibetensis]|uniref:Uncharacterized protein n=2 Tax=Rufibacter tibetensis TaxID=512763 RepID=A0A0N7HX03_9BACT|nr:hypothetical protein DC20_19035 [Rufibacter tibetensis]